jgi:uncharacterized membrane protein
MEATALEIAYLVCKPSRYRVGQSAKNWTCLTVINLVLFGQDSPTVIKVAFAEEQNPRILILSVTKLTASVDVEYE